jgi:CheY-like chemotaxis protein
MDNPPMIRFEVEDSGIGINSAVAPTLFVPYKQTKQLATGGAGMGLYALAMRVDALGGYYGWSKRKDTFEGSLFWFTIPYKSGDVVVPIHQRNSMLEALHGSTTLAYKTGRDGGVERNSKRIVLPDPMPLNLNILVVDESPAIVKMSVKMLTQMGHRVTAVKNGSEAIQTMDREFTNNTFTMEVGGGYFDVVLMDMNLAEDGGAVTTRLIRKTESEKDGGTASSMQQLVTAHSDNHRLKAVPNKSKETTVDYKSRGGQGSDEISMRNRKKYAPQPPAPHHCAAHQIIIGVSIVTDSETLEAALAAGLDGCIAKPFTTFSFNEAYLSAVKKNAKK